MAELEKRLKRPSWRLYARIGFGLIVAVVLLWLSLGFAWYASFPPNSEPGTYGDSFGVVNSLFSGLAFAGVVLAIIIQIVELRVTWEEIEDSRIAQQQTAQQQYVAAMVSAINGLQALEVRRAVEWPSVIKEPRHFIVLMSDYRSREMLANLLEQMVAKSPRDDEVTRIGISKDRMEKIHVRLEIAREVFEHIVVTNNFVDAINGTSRTRSIFADETAATTMEMIDKQLRVLASDAANILERIDPLVAENSVATIKAFAAWPDTPAYKKMTAGTDVGLAIQTLNTLLDASMKYLLAFLGCFDFVESRKMSYVKTVR